VAARELSRLDRSRLFGMVRELFRLRGADLARTGALADAEDVTHLTIAEALTAGGPPKARELVRRRREQLAAYGRLPAYPRVAFAGPLVERSPLAGWAVRDGAAPRREAGSALRGEGCSSGTAEAAALVVRGPLAPGAGAGRILVTEATDPGWVFHLATAAGVVSEKGSLLSHTAIVARELGVPFVAGVAGATSLLADSDRVRIDGAAGTVELLACGPAETPAGFGGEGARDRAPGGEPGGEARLSKGAGLSNKVDGAGGAGADADGGAGPSDKPDDARRADAGGRASGYDGMKASGRANGRMGVQP
jgi:phosphohistidine swiveling domain-containing protein